MPYTHGEAHRYRELVKATEAAPVKFELDKPSKVTQVRARAAIHFAAKGLGIKVKVATTADPGMLMVTRVRE